MRHEILAFSPSLVPHRVQRRANLEYSSPSKREGRWGS
jgi:hypothetical protein